MPPESGGICARLLEIHRRVGEERAARGHLCHRHQNPPSSPPPYTAQCLGAWGTKRGWCLLSLSPSISLVSLSPPSPPPNAIDTVPPISHRARDFSGENKTSVRWGRAWDGLDAPRLVGEERAARGHLRHRHQERCHR